MEETIITNSICKEKKPFFTIITPIYNRSKIVNRTFESVKKQSFKDFEYIIVDDGSTDDIDQVVESFMKTATFPIMYIKKQNGGVHTARNLGIKYGNGVLVIMIDSDDELTENCLQDSYDEWNSIPEKDINSYYQMKRTM